MSEIIDFSEREEEFLSRDLIQKVVSYALISAVLGFAFSALVFLGKRAGPASALLDRRAAEGEVVSAQRARPRSGSGGYAGTFTAPNITPRTKRSRGKELESWKNVQHLKAEQLGRAKTLASKPIKKPKKRVVQANLDTKTKYKQAKKRASVKKSSTKKLPKRTPKASDRGRLLYPTSGDRPEKRSFAEIQTELQKNLVFIPSQDKGGYVGLVLDGSGKILASSQAVEDGVLSRVWIDGSPKSARLLSEDKDHGCAILKVPAGNYETLKFAPAPPSSGQELLAYQPKPRARGTDSFQCESGLRFGKAGFIIDGEMRRQQPGSPVFNDRGEVVGFHVSSLPSLPGRGYALAADSSVLYRLARGYEGPSGSLSSFENEALVGLSAFLAGQRDDNKSPNGRIIPGQGVSFFQLGMSRSEAKKRVSQPEESTLRPGLDLLKSPAPPVDLYFAHDRLVLVSTEFRGFSTLKGLATGSELNERQLGRQFENGRMSATGAFVPGLDILLNRSKRVVRFVARADMGRR